MTEVLVCRSCSPTTQTTLKTTESLKSLERLLGSSTKQRKSSYASARKRGQSTRRLPGSIKIDTSLGCGLRTPKQSTCISTADRPLKVVVIGRKPADDWFKALGFRHCGFVRFTYNPKFISKQVYGVDKVIAVGRTASDFLLQMAIPHHRLMEGGVEACKQWLGR